MGDDYSYWEIFYNPDIPLLERIGGAILFPIAAPLAVLSSTPGCTLQPDTPAPLPETAHPLPLPAADISAINMPDAGGPIDIYTCVPEPCAPGLIETTRAAGGMAPCLSFMETAASVQLTSTVAHNAISIVDVNRDGWDDVYLLNSDAPNQLFMNEEGASFREAGADYGLNLNGGHRAAAWVDTDADGDLALLLAGPNGSRLYRRADNLYVPTDAATGIVDPEPGTAAAWIGEDLLLGTENGTRFYQRQPDGSFIEDAALAGMADPGQAAAIRVADYDGDGAADIYLANITGINRLFRNLGDGQFVSVEEETGTAISGQAQSMDAVWVRHAGEEWPSLYVTNWDAANQFYLNNQDGTFTETATPLGIRDPGNTMRATWGDFLNEGRPALFLSRWGQENLLYLPQLDGSDRAVPSYLDIAYPMGMSGPAKTIDAVWFDYDHDERLDLLVVMADGGLQLYHNATHPVMICPKRGDE